MSSNEHPDMSGNPMDAPYICDECGCEMDIDKAFGSRYDEDKIFCSNDCVGDYEIKIEENMFGKDLDGFTDEHGD
jgi:hypothetical protein